MLYMSHCKYESVHDCVRAVYIERASVRLFVIVYVKVRVKECVCACKCIMCFCWCENVYD